MPVDAPSQTPPDAPAPVPPLDAVPIGAPNGQAVPLGPVPHASALRDGTLGRAPHRAWLLFFVVAAIEVISHFVEQSRVAPWSDWTRAADHVRVGWEAGDVVTAAPHWADPLMRAAVGDRLDLSSAGRADLAPYRRLWSLSIRGHRAAEAPETAPEHAVQFGRVRVERWRLPSVPVQFDLVEHIGEAEVALMQGGLARPCRWTAGGRPSGGGLGAGPITPGQRHVCDPARPWLWVGATVEEDLAMLPRRCVWQHPQGHEPVRATFRGVPLGDEVVLHAGLWWEHERTLDGGDVDVAVRLDGEEIGRLVHRDGDGWKRLVATIPEARRGGRGTLDVEVSSGAPHLRTLCWAASTRGAGAMGAAGAAGEGDL